MNLTFVYCFIVILYLLLGIIFCIYYWNKYYKKDYYEAKKTEICEEDMVGILLIIIELYWPFLFINEIFKIFINKIFKKIKLQNK